MHREAGWAERWPPPSRKNFPGWRSRLWGRIPLRPPICSRQGQIMRRPGRADIIIGPVGIAIADSMYGEITPAMAAAVGRSGAKKLLIPMNQCNNIIVGVKKLSMSDMVEAVIAQLKEEIVQ